MSFKQLKIEQFGNPISVLSLANSAQVPSPTDDEIVIKVLASPVHPMDLLLVTGHYGLTKPPLPVYPGAEGVGRIHALGKNVNEFQLGQRVAFYSAVGSWSEYVVLKKPFSGVLPVPDAIPDTIAGQLFINPLTALAILAEINAKSDEWILQTAAGSVLGQMIIQLAAAKGLKLINVVRRPAQVKELKERYGDQIHVVVFDGTSEREATNEINVLTQNKGVQYVLEAVGGSTTEFALSVLNTGGRLLLYGGSGGVAEFKLSLATTLFKVHRIEGFRLEPWIAGQGPEAMRQLIGELVQLLATGKLVPALEDVFALEDFQTAIVKSVTPGKLGKVFLAPNPSIVTKNTSFTSK